MCSFASRGRLHYIGFLLLVLLIGSQSSRAQPAGQWTDVIPLPSIPIAAALLPDGRVLGWSSNTLTTFEGDIGATPSQTFTSLTTPQSGQSASTLVTNPPHDMFCPGTAYLPNGQILVNGGSSSPETSIYDPPSSTWSSDAEMNVPRGYNASVLLSQWIGVHARRVFYRRLRRQDWRTVGAGPRLEAVGWHFRSTYNR